MSHVADTMNPCATTSTPPTFTDSADLAGATHHDAWDALDQPNCTLLEVLLIDLDDSAAYANALEFILLCDALQGRTLRGLHHGTLMAMLGSNGMVGAFVGWGVGADRIASAWRMVIQEAASQGYDVMQANSALAVLTGQVGDIRWNESKVLEEMMLQRFGSGCLCEVATSFDVSDVGQISITLFLGLTVSAGRSV